MYLKSISELNCVINKNQGTCDFINKSKVLLGLEPGKTRGRCVPQIDFGAELRY